MSCSVTEDGHLSLGLDRTELNFFMVINIPNSNSVAKLVQFPYFLCSIDNARPTAKQVPKRSLDIVYVAPWGNHISI